MSLVRPAKPVDHLPDYAGLVGHHALTAGDAEYNRGRRRRRAHGQHQPLGVQQQATAAQHRPLDAGRGAHE